MPCAHVRHGGVMGGRSKHPKLTLNLADYSDEKK